MLSTRSFGRRLRANHEPLSVHGDDTQTQDFVHVADVIRANLAAAVSDRAVGEAVNVGTGWEVSIRELVETVCEVTDSDSEITDTDPRSGDIERSHAAMERTRSVLDFDAAVPLES